MTPIFIPSTDSVGDDPTRGILISRGRGSTRGEKEGVWVRIVGVNRDEAVRVSQSVLELAVQAVYEQDPDPEQKVLRCNLCHEVPVPHKMAICVGCTAKARATTIHD